MMPNIFRKSSVKYWVLAIICISFLAKFIIGYSIKDSFFRRGNSFSALNAIAFNLVDHLEFSVKPGIPSIDYEPLYPGILALSYKIFGKNWFGVTFFQAILFAFTSWLLYLIGRTLRDELTGFLASAYHSLYPFMFFHSLSVIDTTMFVFVFVLLLFLLIVPLRKLGDFWRHALVGSAIGISLLSRGSALFLLPATLLYLFIKQNRHDRLIRILVLFLSALFIVSPWIIRNYKLSKGIMISVHGSFGLWQGNNEKSRYYLENDISLDKVYLQIPPPGIYQEYPLRPRLPFEAKKVAKLYQSAAIEFIKSHPKEFMKLSLLKFIKLWSWNYNPRASSYEHFSLKTRQWLYFISYVPLLFSMPFGLYFLARKNISHFLLLLGIIIFYTGAHMIVMGYSRLRLPLDVILMLFFGMTISTFLPDMKSECPSL